MTLSTDTYEAALQTVDAATHVGVPLKLLGGQAIRYLTPDAVVGYIAKHGLYAGAAA